MTLVSERTLGFTESVIREMTRLAEAHGAINLAQGFPDADPPPEMIEAAVNAIRGGINQYGITWGARCLREAIARKTERTYGLRYDPESEVTVTCGSTEAMIATLLAVINPGDEVIVFEPFYENYGPDTILSNATPRYVTLHPVNEDGAREDASTPWSFEPDDLIAAFNDRTKAIVINTPNNPTGKVFNREELSLIAGLCERWNVLAITDEIYDHITYDGHRHVSLAALEGMRDRTITINAISKTYSATGWRVGWAQAPEEITRAIRKVHDFLTVGAPHPLQVAAATALDLPDSYYVRLVDEYESRRAYILGALQQCGFHCWKPAGAYYVMTDYTAVRHDFETMPEDDVTFARYLVREVGIAAVPGSSFYHDPALGRRQIRFSFGRRMELLREAMKRLQLRGLRDVA